MSKRTSYMPLYVVESDEINQLAISDCYNV